MKKLNLFEIAKSLVYLHFSFAIISLIINLRLLESTHFERKSDGEFKIITGNYFPIEVDWYDKGAYYSKNIEENSPEIYVAKKNAEGIIQIKLNSKLGILMAFLKLIEGLIYIYWAYLLTQIFKNFSNSKPFSKQNANRIRDIGIFIFLGVVLKFFSEWLIANQAENILDSYKLIKYHHSKRDLFFQSNLYVGIVIVIISIIYKRGVELQEETELTV